MLTLGQMSDLKASTNEKYLINFGFFPREIRNAIYRECVVVEEHLNILNFYRVITPLINHDKKIYETFGVLDGKNGHTSFADEAREVFFAENTFIVPCSELPDFLLCQYTRSFGSSFEANLYVRSLIVTIHYEAGDREVFWLFGNEVPELRRLLDCPHLQKLELSICAPGGPAAEFETTQKIVDIMDVCVELWKKLGRGMKTFVYDYIPTKEEEDDEDEGSSEMDCNGQSSDEDGEYNTCESEDGHNVYYCPGEDTLEEGVYYRFRRFDDSKIWQGWLERLKEMGEE